MSPDDPRHGTTAGHNAGCLCDPCCAAKLAYDKMRRLDEMRGKARKVPTWRAARRINALYALGWTSQQIADVAGLHRQVVHQFAIEAHETMYATTFAGIDEAYRSLSMRVPKATTRVEKSVYVRRVNLSKRLGHMPPLAWENIDDPDERPTDWQYREPTRGDLLDDMDENGAGISEAVRTLNVSRDALEKWCARNGRGELYSRLVARESVGQVYRNQHTKGAA